MLCIREVQVPRYATMAPKLAAVKCVPQSRSRLTGQGRKSEAAGTTITSCTINTAACNSHLILTQSVVTVMISSGPGLLVQVESQGRLQQVEGVDALDLVKTYYTVFEEFVVKAS